MRSFTRRSCASHRILATRARSRLSSCAPNVVMKQSMLSLCNVAQLGVGAAIVGSLFYFLYSNGNTKPLPAMRLRDGSSEKPAAVVDAKQGTRNEPGTQDELVENGEGGIAVGTTGE